MKKPAKKLLTLLIASQLALSSVIGNVAWAEEQAASPVIGAPYGQDGQYDHTIPHVIINQVYGGGLTVDSSTPVTHGFIELYNPTATDVDLTGWSLQYADRPAGVLTGPTNDWQMLELEGVIPAYSSFLVLANPTTSESKRLDLSEQELADQEWDLYISNKGMKLVLLSNTNNLNEPDHIVNPWSASLDGTPVAGYVDMVGAAANNYESIEENNIDGYETAFRYGDANGPSKQKALRRIGFIDTDNNETDFEIVPYNKASVDVISEKKPRSTKDGAWGNELLVDTIAPLVVYGGQAIEVELTASGGVKPYSWAVDGLPEGLELVNGRITGTAQELSEETTYTIIVTATDAAASADANSKQFTLKVMPKQELIQDLFQVNKIAEYSVGVNNKDGGVAEIVKYNKDNNKFYLVNGSTNPPSIDIVSLQQANGVLSKEDSIDVKSLAERDGFTFGDLTSVAIDRVNKRIYVAVQEADHMKDGMILALDYDGEYISHYRAGAQPDMITVTADGHYVLTADEAEARDGVNDPKGSVTIVNTATGSSQQLYFTDGSIIDDHVHIRGAGGHITEKGAKEDAALDLEPEYIAISQDQQYAYVSLQENNAIAMIDIKQAKLLALKGLGLKDHSLPDNAIDLLNDGAAKVETAPFYGIYMPDGIAAQSINGKTYLFTANEGDATEWSEGDTARYNNSTVGAVKGQLSPDSPAAQFLQDKSDYDALEVATDWGNDSIYLYGARSFSIWDGDSLLEEDQALTPVYDSGSDFEVITGQRVPDFYNVSNSKVKLDERSVKKGPEPEDIKTGVVGNHVLAFIGLERVGGFMTYDVSNPSDPLFANYTNTRQYLNDEGKVNLDTDTGPEGLEFISAEDSPTGLPLLLVAYEVGGKVGVYQLEVTKVSLDRKQISLVAGGAAVKLNATVEQPVEAGQTGVSWSSSNEKVAKVDEQGNVTPISRGLAVITVMSEDGYGLAEATVTVTSRSSNTDDVPPTSDQGEHAGEQGNSGSNNGSNNGNDTVVLIATATEGTAKANTSAVQLQQWLAEGMKQLVVEGEGARITLDSNVIAALAASGDNEITIQIKQVNELESEALLQSNGGGSHSAELASISGRPLFELKLEAGNQSLDSWNEGQATVELAYTPQSDEDVSAIVAYHVTSDGEIQVIANSYYDVEQGRLIFKTTHFSYYAVGYNKAAFLDINNSFAQQAITYLSARELLLGVGDNQFAPQKLLTRADFTVILARIAEASLTNQASTQFTDVSNGAYYAAAVEWAASNGIVSGMGNGKFAPNAIVTREEMAMMLVRFAKQMNIQLPLSSEAISFQDEEDISSIARLAVQKITRAAIIEGKPADNGEGRIFAPNAAATREEAAKVLYKLLQLR